MLLLALLLQLFCLLTVPLTVPLPLLLLSSCSIIVANQPEIRTTSNRKMEESASILVVASPRQAYFLKKRVTAARFPAHNVTPRPRHVFSSADATVRRRTLGRRLRRTHVPDARLNYRLPRHRNSLGRDEAGGYGGVLEKSPAGVCIVCVFTLLLVLYAPSLVFLSRVLHRCRSFSSPVRPGFHSICS